MIPYIIEQTMIDVRGTHHKVWERSMTDEAPEGQLRPSKKRRTTRTGTTSYAHTSNCDENGEHPSLSTTVEIDDNGRGSEREDTFQPLCPISSGTSSFIDATLHEVQVVLREKQREVEEKEIFSFTRSPRQFVMLTVRSTLIDSLISSHGDVNDPVFTKTLCLLKSFYLSSGYDACSESNAFPNLFDGSWVNVSRPSYQECLGTNKEGDFMYTLGRMSFDMFQPGSLSCSIQSTHSTIKRIGRESQIPSLVPRSLLDEVALSRSEGENARDLRSYDIAVSLTIEPRSDKAQGKKSSYSLRALMTVKGYLLPDPDQTNRLTVWFTSGKLSPATLPPQMKSATNKRAYGGFKEWESIFNNKKRKKTWLERAKVMAAKVFLGADIPEGMDEDGSMSYTLHRKTYLNVSVIIRGYLHKILS